MSPKRAARIELVEAVYQMKVGTVIMLPCATQKESRALRAVLDRQLSVLVEFRTAFHNGTLFILRVG